MNIRYFLFFALLATAVLGFGFSKTVQGVTIDELLARIAQLRAQLQALLAQQSATSAWCHTFSVNLRYGDKGSEIDALQTALRKESIETGWINSEFDDGTASALVEFQEKYASEILTPYRLKHGTGFGGPATRAKLNILYGCKTTIPSSTDQSPSTISSQIFPPAIVQPSITAISSNNTENTSVPTAPASAAPSINSFSVSSGKVGATVIITGSNFSRTGNEVHFGVGGLRADSANGSTITFQVPRSISPCDFIIGPPYCMAASLLVQPGDYDVYVKTASGQSNKLKFTVTSGIMQ